MYPAYKLNDQGDNIQPWRTPFPIWNQSVVPCPSYTIVLETLLGGQRSWFFQYSCSRCESWTIKKAKELMLWNRGVGEDSWESFGLQGDQTSQSQRNPEYALEGLRLKLKLQYFGHLMQKAYSLEKTLMLGNLKAGEEGDDRGWDGWTASLIQWIWVWANSGRWWRAEKPGMLQSMGPQRVGHGHDLATKQQQREAH